MEFNGAKRQKLDVLEPPQVHSDIMHGEMAWNEDMNVFFNDSWEFEMDFMNEESIEWSELCHSPKSNTKCSMCGDGDHNITSCPNSCCLKCGEKTDTFQDECAKCLARTSAICEICGYRGHLKNDCPNSWRCYYNTIDTMSATKYSMLDNPPTFQFNWDINERDGGFYQRFLNANKKRTANNMI